MLEPLFKICYDLPNSFVIEGIQYDVVGTNRKILFDNNYSFLALACQETLNVIDA